MDITKSVNISGKHAHDLRYPHDTDTISLAVMDNSRVVTAHKDLKIICWNIEQGIQQSTTTQFSTGRLRLFSQYTE